MGVHTMCTLMGADPGLHVTQASARQSVSGNLLSAVISSQARPGDSTPRIMVDMGHKNHAGPGWLQAYYKSAFSLLIW